jgi:hypothetical protein
MYCSIPPSEVKSQIDGFTEDLKTSGFNSSLVSVLQDLVRFTYAVNYAIDHRDVLFHPRAFDEDTVLLQRALLAFLDTETGVEKACRIGALIYMKSIIREFPSTAISSKRMVQRLKSSLTSISEDARIAPVLLWLYFMGGIASQGSSERAWFVAHLLRMTFTIGRFPSWEGVKGVLKKVLWVEPILEKVCKMLWNEVEMTRNVLNGKMP